jgi:urea transport system permease protein
VNLGFYTVKWVDWWLVLLGLSFVAVTILAPKGIGGLVDIWSGRRTPARHGLDLGPGQGSLREREAEE